MKTRIFRPLPSGHPLVTSDAICSLCKKRFHIGERIVLAPAREPQSGWETVPAAPLHARCALNGAKTPVGIISNIHDGDGTPYPIVTGDGKSWTVEEAGCDQ